MFGLIITMIIMMFFSIGMIFCCGLNIYENGKNGENMNYIIDNIYLGNWQDSEDIEQLKSNNIKSVLTLNHEHSHSAEILNQYAGMGISTKYIKIHDSTLADITPYLTECVEWIKSQKGNVLVHCTAGVSRSATVVAAYIVKEKKYTPKQALEYVKQSRHIAGPNPSFVAQLHNWAQKQ